MADSNLLRMKEPVHRDRSAILIAMGAVLLLIGVVAAFYGPMEMYAFYLFSEGGRFHYDGFGFGSFMFGNLATQIIGYYVVAALLIPLGYGHVRQRNWIRPYALTLLWSWLVLGIPLAAVFLMVLLSSKDLPIPVAIGAVALVGLSYAVLPWLLIRFYRGENVRNTLKIHDPGVYWLNRTPIPVLVLAFLLAVYAVVLHIPILFNGLFPLFGGWMSGLAGILALDGTILSLLAISVGVLTRRRWAWWAALLLLLVLTVSSLMTLLPSTFEQLLDHLAFPPYERTLLSGVPLQGAHIAAFIVLPLALTMAVLVVAAPHFGRRGEALLVGSQQSSK